MKVKTLIRGEEIQRFVPHQQCKSMLWATNNRLLWTQQPPWSKGNRGLVDKVKDFPKKKNPRNESKILGERNLRLIRQREIYLTVAVGRRARRLAMFVKRWRAKATLGKTSDNGLFLDSEVRKASLFSFFNFWFFFYFSLLLIVVTKHFHNSFLLKSNFWVGQIGFIM